MPMPSRDGIAGINRALFWTDERATISCDAWVLILSFVWLTPLTGSAIPPPAAASWSADLQPVTRPC
jgi:hypothetical protein